MRTCAMPLCAAILMAWPWPVMSQPVPPAQAASASSPAAAPAPLSLARAIETAVAFHPEVVAARHELAAAVAAREQAGAGANPTLALESEGVGRPARVTTVQLSQPLQWGDVRRARTTAADRGRDVAQARLALAIAQTRANVMAAFADAQAAQHRVALAGASVALAEAGSHAAARRVLAGRLSPVDETRARVAASVARSGLVQAQGALRMALSALRAASALPPASFDGVAPGAADTLPDAFDDATLGERLRSAPVVHEARLEAERQAALADLERARRTADVTVSVGARRDAGLGQTLAVVGVSMPLPLRHAQQGAEREAARRADQAAALAQAVALKAEAEVRAANERLSAARTEADLLRREVLPEAAQAHEAAVRGFELGKFAYADVLDAQRTLLQARAQQLAAWTEAHRARIDLERVLGPEPALPPAPTPLP